MSCPEYRRALLGVRSAPLTHAPAAAGQMPVTLQEVFKNERVMEAASAGSPSSSEQDAAVQGLEPEVPRGPATSPADSPPPPRLPGDCDPDPGYAAACARLPGTAPHSLQGDGEGAATSATWLVDAVHLLKEYYLKRAQLSLETNIAASRHQLVVPERDVCRRDVGVGEGVAAVDTTDRYSSTASPPPAGARRT